MKTLLLAGALFWTATFGMPYGGDPEFAMVPSEDGWKLVNINAEPEMETFYNPETDIIFTLYTNDNQNGQVVQWNDPSWIPNSRFNPANPTRVTIHGWGGSTNGRVNRVVRAALFQVGNFNVITVDWSAGADSNNYLTARNRVGPTGHVVGALLEMLHDNTGADLRHMQTIGHSLGGHVAGFAGKYLQGRLGSVMSLDPAGPLFNINNPDGRTDATDALYVETVLTNAGLLGFDEPIGHSTFYPNWGRRQPGCGLDVGGTCAHSRSHELYAESITSQVGFWARRCRDYQDILNENCISSGPDTIMGGEPLRSTNNGVYFFETNGEAPFALGRM